jgi:hypothetical protein
MNYCLIEDAWKNTDYISDQYNTYNIGEKNIIENFNTNTNIDYGDEYSSNEQNNNNSSSNIPHNIHNIHNNISCDDFNRHLEVCNECKMRIRNRYSSKLIERIQINVLDNKDTILLILIILFLLIFFKLLISIFKK